MVWGAVAQMGVSMIGGYMKAQNMRRQGALNEKIAEMNAEFAELDAYDATVRGQSNKARYQSVVDKTMSAQTANFTAADVDVTYGSAADVQTETRFTAELNKKEIDKAAEEEALGYRQQARDYRVQGSQTSTQSSMNAASAQNAGFQQAVGAYASNYKSINAEFAGATGYGQQSSEG